ncbi:MAG: dihydrofolate reductase [Rhodocyclaceae bacterium]|nr:MAG: dihydrofolate reductase [Rhodocyclaceae bacterium]
MTKPGLTLIAAVAKNGAIGKDNRLLWQLPEDMRHFRETTRGAAVVMGRKTWESLPEKFRPLPGRRNVVVTRQAGYAAPGADLAHSLEDALEKAGGGTIFIIGGAELYAQALPMAQTLILTEVDLSPEADAWFPSIPAAEWRESRRETRVSETGLTFAFVTYERT